MPATTEDQSEQESTTTEPAPTKVEEPKPEEKVEPKPEEKAEPKPAPTPVVKKEEPKENIEKIKKVVKE